MTSSDADYYRLRTEWLRFKSHLYDSLTGLPALPAVVEDVRRLLESRGGAEIVYLDLGRSGWHEAKLGWSSYDQAVREFAGLLASLREAGELGPQDLVCLHTVRSDRFLVFLAASGEAANGGRGERFLKALEQRLSACPHERLRFVRLAGGRARIREDPMVRSERTIQQGVTDAVLASLIAREGTDEGRRSELEQMIARSAVRSVFHPILRLGERTPIGHEALTRPVDVVSFASVEELFSFAETTDLLMEFERLCRATAIRSARQLEPGGLLFLNASAHAVEDPHWTNGSMDELLSANGLAPLDVVVEITERVAVKRHDAFQAALKTFKRRGYRVAVDDMGAGYASLKALAAIEPDFLKFDTSLVRDIDKSSIKRSLLESLRALATKIHARVIAEGIEREEECRTLVELGIELGQGFLFHREEGA